MRMTESGKGVGAAESNAFAGSKTGSRAYRAGIAVAIVTSFLIVWTTVVRDDGTGIGYFLAIMAARQACRAACSSPCRPVPSSRRCG